MKVLSLYVGVLCLCFLVLPPILAANNTREFDPKTLRDLVTRGNFQSAVGVTDHAIAYYRDLVAADPRGEKPWYSLHNAEVGFYMCAKAQLLALRGDFVGADRILSEAKTYASNHPSGFVGFLMSGGWETIVSATHGLILEKAGKRDEAKKAYEGSPSDYGRLALLALGAGDDIKARQLALAAGINPTSCFVLGRLEEKNGHKQAAHDWYNKALVDLQTVKNQFLPIYFCEGPAIVNAQKRLEK
jgi:tetratricopeptide (TPR) repeat protein